MGCRGRWRGVAPGAAGPSVVLLGYFFMLIDTVSQSPAVCASKKTCKEGHTTDTQSIMWFNCAASALLLCCIRGYGAALRALDFSLSRHRKKAKKHSQLTLGRNDAFFFASLSPGTVAAAAPRLCSGGSLGAARPRRCLCAACAHARAALRLPCAVHVRRQRLQPRLGLCRADRLGL